MVILEVHYLPKLNFRKKNKNIEKRKLPKNNIRQFLRIQDPLVYRIMRGKRKRKNKMPTLRHVIIQFLKKK